VRQIKLATRQLLGAR